MRARRAGRRRSNDIRIPRCRPDSACIPQPIKKPYTVAAEMRALEHLTLPLRRVYPFCIMRQIYRWLKNRVETSVLLPNYIGAIAKQWMNILFGETVVGVIFLVWWALGTPPLILIFVVAMFVAGYFAWRADHVRLIPRFEIKEFYIQPTPTSIPHESRVYIQVLPTCLTEVPVSECRGHLLRVCKWSDAKNEWESTELNEPLNLAWSMHDASPLILQPGVGQRLNVCWIDNYGHIVPDIPTGLPLRSASVFNSTDRFRFDIRVTARDCPPVDVFVVVQMGNEWNRPLVSIGG